jgi:hypothetical protein
LLLNYPSAARLSRNSANFFRKAQRVVDEHVGNRGIDRDDPAGLAALWRSWSFSGPGRWLSMPQAVGSQT